MKYEIEIDLPPDVAAKWVPVAYRKARKCECYIYGGIASVWTNEAESQSEYIILVPRVEWPAWCSADWLLKTTCGDIYAVCGEIPRRNAGVWVRYGDAWIVPRRVHADLYAAFKDVPPHLSLIENPKRIKSDSTS